MSELSITGHLLFSAWPVSSHSPPISLLHSPVLTAAPHRQSTQYICPGLTDQTPFTRLLFVTHARLSCCRPCRPLTDPSDPR